MLDGPRGIDHGPQAALRGPEIATLQKGFRLFLGLLPELLEVQQVTGQLFKKPASGGLQVLRVLKPPVGAVFGLGVLFLFFTADLIDRIVGDLHCMELIECEPGINKILFYPLDEGR